MNTKIKKIAYGGMLALMMAAPLVSFAQWIDPTADPNLTGSGLTGDSTAVVITNFMNYLLTIIGILAVIVFIIAGIMYITAAGDEDQIGKAKKAMTYAIIGLVVALLGLVITNAVSNVINKGGE